jgi:HK97 family phage portal protein
MALSIRNPFYFTDNRVTNRQLEDIIRNQFNEAFLWGTLGNEVLDDDLDTKRYIDFAYNINPDVYSIVNQIASKFTSIPYCIRDIEDSESYQKLISLNRSTKYNYSFPQEVKAYDLKQKTYKDEEIPMPFEDPNPEQTWQEFWNLSEIFLQTTGNVYWYMLRPEDGRNNGVPIAIYVLPSHLMEIIVKPKVTIGIDNPVDYYRLKETTRYIKFKEEDVIHIKYSNPNYNDNGSHLYGQSPLRAGYKNVTATNKALDLNINTMKNGGAFGLINSKDPNTGYTEEQGQSIKDRLEEASVSQKDLSRIIATGAAIEFTRISLTADELKPFDHLSYNLKALCNIFGWDDKLLNSDDGAKYDNMKVAEKRVVTGKIVPDIVLFQEAINKHFLPLFKGYENKCIEFKVKELPEMQQDYKTMTEWITNLIDKALITRRKGLAILGMPSDDSNILLDELTTVDDIMTLEDAILPQDNNITV